MEDSDAPGGPALTVRIAERDDLPAMAALAAATFALAGPPDAERGPQRDFLMTYGTPAFFERWRRAPGIVMLIAETKGIPVGLCVGGSGAADGPARLHKLYVSPPWHGTGVAQALVDALLQQLREAAVTTVELNVSVDNTRAVRFYEKCGFVRDRRIDFDVGGDRQQDWLMRRTMDVMDRGERRGVHE